MDKVDDLFGRILSAKPHLCDHRVQFGESVVGVGQGVPCVHVCVDISWSGPVEKDLTYPPLFGISAIRGADPPVGGCGVKDMPGTVCGKIPVSVENVPLLDSQAVIVRGGNPELLDVALPEGG